MHICVCICTYKRPVLLAKLLQALEEQQTDGEFTLSVVVADNDREQSGEAVVKAAQARGALKIVYTVEPEQNIARARNAALRASTGDYLAFIDDDEIPERTWLRNALRFCLRSGADGMLGPVHPYFEHTPPDWLVRGGFCERPEPASGHQLAWRETRTGNALLNRDLVKDDVEPFAVQFGNGGEDQAFFKRLIERGARFLWNNDAPVYELVPPERCTRRYLLERALRRGQSERTLTDAQGIFKSVIAVPVYALSLPFLLVAGQHHFMRYLVRLCDHAGKLLAVAGFRPMGERYVNQ